MKHKVYLDNCCYNRPYDDQSHLLIELETKAKLRIQEMIIDESEEVLKVANFAKSTGLKTKDALHVACAITAKCNYLITTDVQFSKFTDSRIRVISPIEFIIETEVL